MTDIWESFLTSNQLRVYTKTSPDILSMTSVQNQLRNYEDAQTRKHLQDEFLNMPYLYAQTHMYAHSWTALGQQRPGQLVLCVCLPGQRLLRWWVRSDLVAAWGRLSLNSLIILYIWAITHRLEESSSLPSHTPAVVMQTCGQKQSPQPLTCNTISKHLQKSQPTPIY